jgi:hypothetical protein
MIGPILDEYVHRYGYGYGLRWGGGVRFGCDDDKGAKVAVVVCGGGHGRGGRWC